MQKAVALAVVALVSCRSTTGPDAGARCDEPESALASPRVSFRADVVPVIERSCAFASCHGSATSDHGVFIGRGDPDRVHAALVGKMSARYTGQIFVVPGDPSHSFLVRKLHDGFCGLDCGDAGCGDRMPRKNAPLPGAERLALARWIRQGAKND